MGGRHSSRFHVAESDDSATGEASEKGEAPEGVPEGDMYAREEGGER